MKLKNLILILFIFLNINIINTTYQATSISVKSLGKSIKNVPNELINILNILKYGLKKYPQRQDVWQDPDDNLRLDQATIFGTHESFQSDAYGYKNQLIQKGSIHHEKPSMYSRENKDSQLNIGARYLDLRIWYRDNDIYLCHGNCNSFSQKFIKPDKGFTKLMCIFKEIVNFMQDTDNWDNKPVLIVSLQGGIEEIPIYALRKVIWESGIGSYLLKTNNWNFDKEDNWPTYGWLRSKNKRIILGSNKIIDTKYIFSDIFAKPRWDNIPTDNNRFLILEFGAQTDNKYINNINSLIKKLEKKEDEYRSSYIIRTMIAWWPIFKIIFKRGTINSLSDLNSKMPTRYAEFIYQNGFKDTDNDQILWKEHYPNIIAADFIKYGNISKAVQDINRNLRNIR